MAQVIMVKITKSSMPEYWYANCIGVTFRVIDVGEDDYSVVNIVKDEPRQSLLWIRKTDCEIIEKGDAK